MPKVFVSYRRDDSAYVAHNIYAKLARHFGKASVMFDVDSIPVAVDFREYLNDHTERVRRQYARRGVEAGERLGPA